MAENRNNRVVVVFFSGAAVAEQAIDALGTWDRADDDGKPGSVDTMR